MQSASHGSYYSLLPYYKGHQEFSDHLKLFQVLPTVCRPNQSAGDEPMNRQVLWVSYGRQSHFHSRIDFNVLYAYRHNSRSWYCLNIHQLLAISYSQNASLSSGLIGEERKWCIPSRGQWHVIYSLSIMDKTVQVEGPLCLLNSTYNGSGFVYGLFTISSCLSGVLHTVHWTPHNRTTVVTVCRSGLQTYILSHWSTKAFDKPA